MSQHLSWNFLDLSSKSISEWERESALLNLTQDCTLYEYKVFTLRQQDISWYKRIYSREGSEVGGRGQRVWTVVHKVSQTELTTGVLPKCCPASTCNPHRALHIKPLHRPLCVRAYVCYTSYTQLKKNLTNKHAQTGTCLLTNGVDLTHQDSSGGVSSTALAAPPPHWPPHWGALQLSRRAARGK